MNIGLIDVDGFKGYPNFALMKISAYHKDQGDDVEWAEKGKHYNKVYASKIFTFTPDYDYSGIDSDITLKGGTGYDIEGRLEPDIDNFNKLDYSIYPDCDFSL